MGHRNAPDDAVAGAILAGGLGRRLGGGDKALVLLAGRPLASYAAAQVKRQLAPGRLLLNANGPPRQYAALGLPVVADDVAGRPGPLAGILASMRAAKAFGPAVRWLLTVPTDTPFLPRDLLARLQAGLGDGNTEIALAASASSLCQVCGLWSLSLEADLVTALSRGQNKVLDFAERHRWRRVEFPSLTVTHRTVDPFFNVNRPEELALAAQLIGSLQS